MTLSLDEHTFGANIVRIHSRNSGGAQREVEEYPFYGSTPLLIPLAFGSEKLDLEISINGSYKEAIDAVIEGILRRDVVFVQDDTLYLDRDKKGVWCIPLNTQPTREEWQSGGTKVDATLSFIVCGYANSTLASTVTITSIETSYEFVRASTVTITSIENSYDFV